MAKMRKAVDKREDDIKKKLTAAIMMLLVSCIMVVTSTYAWFTLSTAPEVTGIQTTIGGNGNLEIALANAETWNDPTKVATLSGAAANITKTNVAWGNLINVAKTADGVDNYGIDLLKLAPAKLSVTAGTGTNSDIVNSNYFELPTYGADGRVSNLVKNVLSATYNSTSKGFAEGTSASYGLRAFGLSTAMTARQSAWMSKLSEMSTNYIAAQSGVSNALYNGGSTLGGIAVKLATAADRAQAKFNQKEYDAVYDLIYDSINSVKHIDTAILNAIDAAAASSANQGTNGAQLTDDYYELVSQALSTMKVYDGDDTRADDITINESSNSITISYKVSDTLTETATFQNETLVNVIKTYKQIRKNLEDALNALPENQNIANDTDTYLWGNGTTGTFSAAVNYLMNLNGDITVGGKNMDQLKDLINTMDTNEIMKLANNPVVELGKDSGVFYDIASLVGTVKATISLTVQYGSLSADLDNAVIQSTCNTPLLPAIRTVINGAKPESAGSAEASVISDIYAYGLDLLFRTNANGSDLQLQTTPTDRIYSDNYNQETMGNGSTMTFEKTVASFSDESMLKLMDSIEIVFVDKTLNVLGYAGLDTRFSYKKDAQGNFLDKNGAITVKPEEYVIDTTNYVSENGKITVNILMKSDSGKVGVNGVKFIDSSAAKICSLTQNQAMGVSVLVYLNGESVTNADVANASSSMTGTMNLQFSSSATLTPMDYSGLHSVTKNEKLTTPTLTYDTSNITVTTDENTTSLNVYVNGSKSGNTIVYNGKANFNAADFIPKGEDGNLVAGDYTFAVESSAGGYPTSDKSATVTYTVTTSNGGYSINVKTGA